MRCWGLNYSGQLGDGTGSDSYTPVRVSGIGTAVAISVGVIHTCAVLRNGTVRCWGNNSSGQIGDGTTTDAWTPVAVNGIATAIGAVGAGNNDSCVLLRGGGVRCWGLNTYGSSASARLPTLTSRQWSSGSTPGGRVATWLWPASTRPGSRPP